MAADATSTTILPVPTPELRGSFSCRPPAEAGGLLLVSSTQSLPPTSWVTAGGANPRESRSRAMRFNIVRPVARSFSGVCADPNEPIAKPVRIPLYMICLDLAFTAAFNVCAGCLRLSKHDDGDPITRFWASYLPIAWIWDHTNRYFNRFDQNDLISELVVLTLMGGVMAYTLNTKTCFYADELPEAPISAPPPPPAWLLHEGTARQLQWQLDGTVHAPGPGTPLDGSSCFYLAAAFGGCRALTTALTAYVALFKVTLAKRLLWRELALWLLLAPLLAQVASPVDMPYLESAYLELVLLLGCLIDMLISLAGELPKQLRCGVDRNEARLASDAGLDSRYTIMRNERMLIIMLGNVCVTATQGAFSQVRTFGWRDAAACMATPWAAFLLKTWYFELCQIETARDGTVAANAGLHATQRSGMAATLWSLVHMPLIG